MGERRGGAAQAVEKERKGLRKERCGATPLPPTSCPLGKVSRLEHMAGPQALRHSSAADSIPAPQLTRQAGWYLREQAWSLATLFGPG